MQKIARRTFIKSAAVVGFPMIIPASVLGLCRKPQMGKILPSYVDLQGSEIYF